MGKFKKGIKRALSYVMMFVITVVSSNIGMLVLPETAVPVMAAEVYEYLLVSALNDSYVVGINTTDVGDILTIQTRNGDTRQAFTKQYNSSTSDYSFFTKQSNVLDIDPSTYKLTACDKTKTSGRFRLSDAGNGYSYIIQEGTNRYISVGANKVGSELYGVAYIEGEPGQKFKIVPADQKITIDAQSGTANVSSISVKYSTGTGASNAVSATRTNYTLEGWYTEKDGKGEKVYDASGNACSGSYWNGSGSKAVWKGISDITLYAYWKLNTYTITYNKNNTSAAGTMNSKACSYGTSYNLDANSFSLTGYHFTKWNTKSDGKGTSYNDKASVKDLGNITLYAQWAVNTYTVKYNANGGTGTAPSDQSCTYGTSFNLRSNSLLRTGYDFAGWNTKQDGKGTTYSAGGSVSNLTASNGGTVTLYAKWTPHTYTVKYDANGGTGTVPGSQSCTYGTAFNLRKNSLTKNGYDSDGWNTKKDGTGTTYASEASVSNLTSASGGTVQLFAKWKPKSYIQTIYFYKNGTKTATKTYSANYDSTFDAEGHRGDVAGETAFAHCHFSSIGSKSWKVTGTGSTNVYYVWDAQKVNYYGNGNTGGSTASTSTDYGATVTISGCGFTKTGYSFTGWNTKSDGKGTAYAAGAKFTSNPANGDSTLELYAQWKSNVYSLIFDANGGLIDGKSQKPSRYITYLTYNFRKGTDTASGNDALDWIKPGRTTRTGYTLTGWYTGTDLKTKVFGTDVTRYSASGFFDTNGNWTKAENSTVYAGWSPNSYTVTFNANGGTSNLSEGTVTFGKSNYWDISWAKNSRSGYEFAGWNTKADGTGTAVWDKDGHAINGTYWSVSGDSRKWKYADNLTVYAVWKDTTPPVLSVSPTGTDGKYVKSVELTITASDNEALSTDNSYQYCLSTNSTTPVGTWQNYVSGQSFTAGGNLSGIYYLWIKRVKDAIGNTSASSDYHKYGPYYFDNTPPDLSKILSSYPDKAQIPYGWFSEGTELDFDILDAHSGIQSVILSDFTVTQNIDITESRSFFFDTTGVSFYCITATDNLGNSLKKPFIVKIDKEGVVIPENAVWKGLEDRLTQNRLTLFARWNPNTYTVRFDKNDDDGGSTRAAGTMPDITLTYDKKENLPLNRFERVGYEFKTAGSEVRCWNSSADGTGQTYADGALVNSLTTIPGGTVTLYTQWSPKEYTLTFDYNRPASAAGELKNADEEARSVFFDSELGTLPEPDLDGWEFDGWYDEDGVRISATDIWHYTSDVSIHAEWTVARYEVRLHSMVPSDALPALVRKSPSGWTWNSAGYYSAVFTYDAWNTLPSPDSVYGLTEYSIEGWYKNSLCTTHAGSGTKVWKLSDVNGDIVDLYPLWRDTTGPRITVTPAATINPDVYGNAVKSIDVTIRIEEQGSGLADSNIYQYGFSSGSSIPPSKWTEYSDTTGAAGFSVTLPDLGSTMDGSYYLWIKQVKDRAGTHSTGSTAAATVKSCHVYGIYVFDNTAPAGTVRYVENNAMLGLYDENMTGSPYAVMSISGAADNISGIKGFTLVMSDAADETNEASFVFTEDGDVWRCRFCLYDCLDNPKSVERVRMKVLSEDMLGNVSTLPITQYDFGTLQTGRPVQAGDIGYSIVEKNAENNMDKTANSAAGNGSAPEYVYERDAFRVEAYVENISHKSSGTAFTGGQLGRLRIYTFGHVHTVSADFGSVKKYLDSAYDINPDLGKADIKPPEKACLHMHTFFIPLYCAPSTYTDTTAFGYKGSRVQRRSVVYDVSGTLTHDIRTILKYNTD